MRDCCAVVALLAPPCGHEGAPVAAMRCRHRLCALCGRLRQATFQRRLEPALAELGRRRTVRMALCTLTWPSSPRIDTTTTPAMWADVRRLRRTPWWKAVRGSWGSIELTWSPIHGWHPHVHLILVIDRWSRTDQQRLSEAWLHITGAAVVDIRALSASGAAAEAAKYLAKGVHAGALGELQILELEDAIYARRLVASTGCLRQLGDPEPEIDEVEPGRTCSVCGEPWVEMLATWTPAGYVTGRSLRSINGVRGP